MSGYDFPASKFPNQNFPKTLERSKNVFSFRAVYNTLSNIYDKAFFEAVNYFCKKAPLKMFDQIRNAPLSFIMNNLFNDYFCVQKYI